MEAHRTLRSTIAALVVVLAITGCGGTSAPSVTKQASSRSAAAKAGPPKPTPIPTHIAVTAAKITVDRTGLTIVGSDGSQLSRILYTADPTASIAALAQAIGSTPTTQSEPAGMCNDAQTAATWGSSLRVTWATDPANGGTFLFRADAATVGGVAIQTPQGFHVGDTTTAMAAGTPGSLVTAGGAEVWYDLDADKNGAVAVNGDSGGPINFLEAPSNVNADC